MKTTIGFIILSLIGIMLFINIDNQHIHRAYKDGYEQGVSDEDKTNAKAIQDMIYSCININGFIVNDMEFYCQPIIPLKSE
jgi:hypothetical protein